MKPLPALMIHFSGMDRLAVRDFHRAVVCNARQMAFYGWEPPRGNVHAGFSALAPGDRLLMGLAADLESEAMLRIQAHYIHACDRTKRYENPQQPKIFVARLRRFM